MAKKLIEEKVEEEEQMQKSVRSSNRTPRVKYKPALFLTSENDEDVVAPPSSAEDQFEKLRLTTGETSLGVYVSSVCTPSQFFVQKVGPRSVDLDRLVEEMTAFYDGEAERRSCALTEVSEGEVVAAQWPGDEKWYRAKVVSVVKDEYDEDKTEVEVFFVDFGDYDKKCLEDIFDLRMEYLRLTYQAIECGLANVQPA